MITYKLNILEELKKAGYNTTKLRQEKLISEGSIQYLRNSKPIGIKTLDTICKLLNKQPGDLIEYTPDQMPE